LEILAAIAGLWMLLLGAYSIVAVANSRRGRASAMQRAGIRSAAFSARMGVSTEQGVLGGLFSEVDTLRLQVETLRSEVSALHGDPGVEKAHLRRYRAGQYTELPRRLRRQVREVRNFHRPLEV
jgi:hypothetical protein